MKFFKENSYDIVKLFINQIGIMIFSLVLYFACSFDGVSAETQSTLKILVSVFSTLFYFALIYTAAWDMGAKDIIRIEAGRAERVPFKGGLLSLFANLPNFLLTVPTLILLISGNVDPQGNFVLNVLFRFLLSMYLGIVTGIFEFLPDGSTLQVIYETLGFIVMPLFAVGVTQLGYAFGVRNIRIFGFMNSAKPNKD